MDLTNSLLGDLVTEYASLRTQIYFKSSLIALSRAMQDLVLADRDRYLVIANFQQEKFFRQQERRFQRMALASEHVYVLGVPEAKSSFAVENPGYEIIPIGSTDTLAGERYLVIIGQRYSACLAVRDKLSVKDLRNMESAIEQGERFEGIWTFERDIAYTAADWLLGMIANYRPELKQKAQRARELFKLRSDLSSRRSLLTTQSVDLGIFAQRLVTYLQAGQYKLLKAYKTIATAERKESLINKIAAAQRSSLDPQEILRTTVRELGQLFSNCRCLLYRLNPDDTEVKIEYESKPTFMTSLIGQRWSIADNPLFLAAQAQKSTLAIEDVPNNPYLNENLIIQDKVSRAGIHSWLMVTIRYQGKLLGMLELHYGGGRNFQWKSEDVALIEAVANSAGAALIQASAYANLVDLNHQLESVERVQSNLIAIVGHELRTPLSTVRICLESLATEPDMLPEFRNTMLDTALGDTERLGQLIQDFLTLSKLEVGKAYSNIESLTIDYALNLALRQIKTTVRVQQIPAIQINIPQNLPAVLADIDGLVEVFTKLLDNACKFTPTDGRVMVTAQVLESNQIEDAKDKMLEVIIADTGRGIKQDRLERIFDRFSQSESYLRRTVSGVGLGLVICQKIIQSMGGEIWATSPGENQGSQFHFTLPIDS
ncbi:MAG: ATP-binding protein [Pleurocapsa sp. MO_226.B13]|nr:ATP-binding protein [Pleurocapsa sp. MO_226.B13]